jgi:hypothetical protein
LPNVSAIAVHAGAKRSKENAASLPRAHSRPATSAIVRRQQIERLVEKHARCWLVENF